MFAALLLVFSSVTPTKFPHLAGWPGWNLLGCGQALRVRTHHRRGPTCRSRRCGVACRDRRRRATGMRRRLRSGTSVVRGYGARRSPSPRAHPSRAARETRRARIFQSSHSAPHPPALTSPSTPFAEPSAGPRPADLVLCAGCLHLARRHPLGARLSHSGGSMRRPLVSPPPPSPAPTTRPPFRHGTSPDSSSTRNETGFKVDAEQDRIQVRHETRPDSRLTRNKTGFKFDTKRDRIQG